MGENSVVVGSQCGSVQLLLPFSVFGECLFYLTVEMLACSYPMAKKTPHLKYLHFKLL